MTQYGVWVTNKPVPFQRHRLAQQSELQEGVAGAGDYKAAQRAAGANMSVDVAIGQAFVQVDSGARNGLGFVYSDALENVAVAASDATNPRVDQLVLQWNDSSIPAGVGGDTPTLRVVAGVPTAGATLDTRNGAAALPADAVRLADILVPAASTSVVTANIRDRRPWARGAYWRTLRTAGDYTRTANTLALVDSVNLQPRIECSGAPMRVNFDIDWVSAASAKTMQIDLFIDGSSSGFTRNDTAATLNTNQHFGVVWEYIPVAGSHLIGPAFASVDNITLVKIYGTTPPLNITFEEIVRPSANNT